MEIIGCPKPTNYQKLFERSNDPVRITCEIDSAANYSQEMAKTLFGNIKSMTFDMRAMCACGKYEGSGHIGVTCERCGSKVSSIFCRDIEYKGWIIIPEWFPQLIHPQLFEMVSNILNYLPKEMKRYEGKSYTITDWLLNPSLPIQKFWPEMGNGLTYLNNNWEKVIRFLVSIQPKGKKEAYTQELMTMLDTYKEVTFTNKIPVINEFLHLMTQYNENSTRFQVDESSPMLFEIYSSLCSLVDDENMGKRITQKIRDKRFMKIQLKFVEYAKSLIGEKVAKKGGLIRKSVISGRLHFTSRAVIVPLTDENMGDELYLPWEIMLVSFRSVFVNHLVWDFGFTPLQALRYVIQATYDPGDPLMETIIDMMMKEWQAQGYKGIPCLANRNPSVHLGAAPLMFVTKVVHDRTIHIPTMTIYAMNADFDLTTLFPLSKYSFWGISEGDPRRLSTSLRPNLMLNP